METLINAYIGWRLADNSLVKEYETKPTTKILELPISYRCPKKVINLAQKVLPTIKYAPNAIEGSVEDISYFSFMEKVKPGEVVLSRTNAPLIKCCLKLLKQGKRANVLGKDIGDGLLYLIKKSGKKQLPAFEKWLENYKNSEVARLKAKGINPEIIIDKFDCLTALIEESTSIGDLNKRIKELFSDNDKGNMILFSSIHGFKGKEANTIYIFNWTLRYHPADFEEPNPEDEERNLFYVAITRTKNELFFVNQ